MSAISVRIPKHYHRRLKELAKKDGVSINQFITLAIGEKLSAIDAEAYIAERKARANLDLLDALLSKIPDVPPVREDDAWPDNNPKSSQ